VQVEPEAADERGRHFRFIEAAAQRKSIPEAGADGYGPGHVLLISFDDFLWFREDDLAALERLASGRRPAPPLYFSACYIIGLVRADVCVLPSRRRGRGRLRAAMELDTFGFLPVNRNLEFNDGVIAPLPSLVSLIEDVKEATSEDGFLYPELPRDPPLNARPSFLHKLPDSHVLHLKVAPLDSEFRRGDGAFLMYFVGYMFGYRLQFKGWWFDGRLPMAGRRWSNIAEAKERALLSEAYRLWRMWPEDVRRRFTNLLYMHVRCAHYRWDWERFAVAYMVLDGCHRIMRAVFGLPSGKHRERLDAMLQHFAMPSHASHVQKIIALRNDLFHETLWDDGQPGSGTRAGVEQTDNLFRINDRLLCAIAGYGGPYLTAPWWSIGVARF
jgi:hypothetical protein